LERAGGVCPARVRPEAQRAPGCASLRQDGPARRVDEAKPPGVRIQASSEASGRHLRLRGGGGCRERREPEQRDEAEDHATPLPHGARTALLRRSQGRLDSPAGLGYTAALRVRSATILATPGRPVDLAWRGR